MDQVELRDSVLSHLKYALGKDADHATIYDWRVALSLAVRDRIVDPWFEATRASYRSTSKRVYYLSMEFLIGRLLEDALANTGILDDAKAVFDGFGISFSEVLLDEPDAALGNGGLGRDAGPARGRIHNEDHCLFMLFHNVDGRPNGAQIMRAGPGRDHHHVRQCNNR